MIKKTLEKAICLLPILYYGCSIHSSTVADLAHEQFVMQLNKMYEKNIIDFFPPIDTNSNNWGSFYSSPWDDSLESIFRCCAYYSTKVSATTLDDLENKQYIEKMNYGDSLFLIDVPYMRHTESYRNSMKDSLQIPIANMRYSFFTLGETTDTIIIDNRKITVENEIIPTDLVIYVIEACNGNLWKNRGKSSQEDRPMLSDYWKHGYVKGLAISREISWVCWWAMAW